MSTEAKRSRRYGKRFSAPYAKWPCGHRRNPNRKRRQKRGNRKSVVIVGKA